MPDLAGVKNLQLKIVFCGHLFLISLSTMGYWAPSSYVIYNSALLILLLWGIQHKESEEPIQLAFVVNGCSIILDVFVLAFCFPNSHSAASRFSAAVAILHLVVRPFSTIYLMQIVRERMGSPGLISNMFPAARNESYEDIDRTAGGPGPGRDYDFNTAQQI